MKKILLIVVLCFLGCNSPKQDSVIKSNELKDYRVYEKGDSLYFKTFDAGNPKYTLLIFGMGYYRSTLKIENCFDDVNTDSIKTAKFKPLAKIYRIDSKCETIIHDLERKSTFKIDLKMVKKYKFIYVDLDYQTDELTINYRNTHMPIL